MKAEVMRQKKFGLQPVTSVLNIDKHSRSRPVDRPSKFFVVRALARSF
ncbi:MAG: hypothetical protein ACRC62_09485 [Microcoleus sp.]